KDSGAGCRSLWVWCRGDDPRRLRVDHAAENAMAGKRSSDRQSGQGRRQARATSVPAAIARETEMERLQRSAGNHAVADLAVNGPPPTMQQLLRQDAGQPL